jgi:hypothetical protein
VFGKVWFVFNPISVTTPTTAKPHSAVWDSLVRFNPISVNKPTTAKPHSGVAINRNRKQQF